MRLVRAFRGEQRFALHRDAAAVLVVARVLEDALKRSEAERLVARRGEQVDHGLDVRAREVAPPAQRLEVVHADAAVLLAVERAKPRRVDERAEPREDLLGQPRADGRGRVLDALTLVLGEEVLQLEHREKPVLVVVDGVDEGLHVLGGQAVLAAHGLDLLDRHRP